VQTLTESKNFTGGLQIGGNNLDGGWPSFTPLTSLASCLSGSLAAASSDGAYKIIGTNTIALQVHIAVTTAGTRDYPIITPPFLPNGAGTLVGGSHGSTPKGNYASFFSVGKSSRRHGGSPAISGAGLFLFGAYDSQ
jgi:hypothetical protein